MKNTYFVTYGTYKPTIKTIFINQKSDHQNIGISHQRTKRNLDVSPACIDCIVFLCETDTGGIVRIADLYCLLLAATHFQDGDEHLREPGHFSI